MWFYIRYAKFWNIYIILYIFHLNCKIHSSSCLYTQHIRNISSYFSCSKYPIFRNTNRHRLEYLSIDSCVYNAYTLLWNFSNFVVFAGLIAGEMSKMIEKHSLNVYILVYSHKLDVCLAKIDSTFLAHCFHVYLTQKIILWISCVMMFSCFSLRMAALLVRSASVANFCRIRVL